MADKMTGMSVLLSRINGFYPLVNYDMAGNGNPEPKLSEDVFPIENGGDIHRGYVLKNEGFSVVSHVSLPKGIFLTPSII